MDEQPGTATVLDSGPGPVAEGPGPAQGAEPVPHVTPLELGPLTDGELNQQISDTLPELFKHFHELGQRMGCDPSFVTTIADALEKHGLARREPSLQDRRSKNIVLTPEGETVRDRLFREILAQAPWCTTLDTGERRCLLGLMRKMLKSRGRR